MTRMPDPARPVTGGVDTHKDTHTAVVIDEVGRVLGTDSFTVNARGYAALLAWMASYGQLVKVGVEGTGTYGAGLARHLTAKGVAVVEVIRPNRQTRRRRGKSDPTDAEAAARAALNGEAAGAPKSRDGAIEALRALRVARRGAVKARTQASNQLRDLVVSAPEALRARLVGLPTGERVALAARFRPGSLIEATEATKAAMRSLALRYQALSAEIDGLDAALEQLVDDAAPEGFLDKTGVGTPGGRRLARHCRGQPRPSGHRGQLRRPVRRQPGGRLVWQAEATSTQPRRRSPGELGSVADRVQPHVSRPTHQGLRRTTHQGGKDDQGDHPLLEALRGQGGLQVPRLRRPRCAADRSPGSGMTTAAGAPLGASSRANAVKEILTSGAATACYYALRPDQRPDCQYLAVVRYGPTALCADCGEDHLRPALG